MHIHHFRLYHACITALFHSLFPAFLAFVRHFPSMLDIVRLEIRLGTILVAALVTHERARVYGRIVKHHVLLYRSTGHKSTNNQ